MRPDKSEGKLLLDVEVEQGFDCLITKPTRTEKRGTIITESLIDVLLSNRPELFQYSGNYYPCLSDHALIYGALKQKINLKKPKIITFRSFKNFDSELFKRHLDTAPWHIIQLFDDVDNQVHAWNLIMNDVLNDLAPVKKMRVRDKDVPYMTSEWKSANRVKGKANAKYLKNKTQGALGAQAQDKKRAKETEANCHKELLENQSC